LNGPLAATKGYNSYLGPKDNQKSLEHLEYIDKAQDCESGDVAGGGKKRGSTTEDKISVLLDKEGEGKRNKGKRGRQGEEKAINPLPISNHAARATHRKDLITGRRVLEQAGDVARRSKGFLSRAWGKGNDAGKRLERRRGERQIQRKRRPLGINRETDTQQKIFPHRASREFSGKGIENVHPHYRVKEGKRPGGTRKRVVDHGPWAAREDTMGKKSSRGEIKSRRSTELGK